MKLTERLLEFERRSYLATGNPMHVWNAYSTARAKRIEVPEWVLRYFDKASWDLRGMVTDEVARKDLAPRIARALNLVSDGRGTPFDYDGRWWAYGRKVREFLRRGDQVDHARSFAAEHFGVSTSTIARGAKIYDEVFPEGEAEPEWDADERDLYVDWESEARK